MLSAGRTSGGGPEANGFRVRPRFGTTSAIDHRRDGPCAKASPRVMRPDFAHGLGSRRTDLVGHWSVRGWHRSRSISGLMSAFPPASRSRKEPEIEELNGN